MLNFAMVFFLIWVCPLGAANPVDIDFRARLVKETGVYHMGESIELEVSYSSQAEKKYQNSFAGPSPGLPGLTFQITPSHGVLDLEDLRRGSQGGWATSGTRGFADIGSQPMTLRFDLRQRFRFQRPGHYSVMATRTEV